METVSYSHRTGGSVAETITAAKVRRRTLARVPACPHAPGPIRSQTYDDLANTDTAAHCGAVTARPAAAKGVWCGVKACVRNRRLTPSSDPEKLDVQADAFLNVLDRWTNVGIYVIHHTFTLAELFAMSGFYLTANTVQSASFAAHESVTLFDSLFGSNESSRALSSIIALVRQELLEDERFQAADRGKVASLTALTKALTAFACLQNATWSRSAKRLKMRV